MPKKRKIKNVSDRGNEWHIRFRSRSRRPQEVSFTYEKRLWSITKIEGERDRLVYAYKHEGWDPWSGRLPGQKGGGTLSVDDAVTEYIAHKTRMGQKNLRGGWSARTASTYAHVLHAFTLKIGGDLPIGSVTEADLDGWIYRDDLSSATQDSYRRILKAFSNWLMEKDYAALSLPGQPKRHKQGVVGSNPTSPTPNIAPRFGRNG
ncbi:MAG: hypothetical protein RhofKO_36390 [Rhodothermales bacterium]